MEMPSLVLLAGGLAKRLRPITEKIPKSMIEIAGQPFIAHQLKFLFSQKISKIVICSGFLSNQIEQFVGNGSKFGVEVKYSNDGEKLLGTGGSIKKALPLLGDNFFIMYGDSWLETDFTKIYQKFIASKKLALMTVYKNNNLYDTSNIQFKNNEIIAYEKENKTPQMQHIDWGLGILSKNALKNFTSKKFDLAKVYKNLLGQNQLSSYEVKNRFYEIGSIQGINDTKKMFQF